MSKPWDEKWKIERQLAAGGQGKTAVVIARHDTSKSGVLKTLKRDNQQKDRLRMRREVVSLETLAPLGALVPHVLDHNTVEFNNATPLFVVMEFINGPLLKDLMEQQPLGELKFAQDVAASICSTFRIGHQNGVLHRDLKPDNLIVSSRDPIAVTVLDYGLSFNLLGEDLTETEETFRNKFLDLPETVAPGGDMRDPRSDVTAIAAIFFYCLTAEKPGQLIDGYGRPPHMRSGSIYSSIASGKSWNADVSRILTRAFSQSLENRYQSIGEFEQELNAVRADSGLPSDAAALARHLTNSIRSVDFASRRSDFEQRLRPVFSQIQSHLMSYAAKFGDFEIALSPPTAPSTIPGENLREISRPMFNHRIKHKIHAITAFREYVAVERNNRCVLFAHDYLQLAVNTGLPTVYNPKGTTEKVDAQTTEICTFDDEFALLMPRILSELDQWLTRSLTKLAEMILPK